MRTLALALALTLGCAAAEPSVQSPSKTVKVAREICCEHCLPMKFKFNPNKAPWCECTAKLAKKRKVCSK